MTPQPDEAVVAFEIHYADSIFTNIEGSWEEAPDGIHVGLIYWTEAGPTLSHGVSEYRLPGHELVKNGAWMDDETYDRRLRKMYERARVS